MRRYSEQELNRIFTEIAPQRGLMVPVSPGAAAARRPSGPAVGVYLRHSEMLPGTPDIVDRYWSLLRQVPVKGGVGVLASINTLLSEHRSLNRDVHEILGERFLTESLAARVAEQRAAGPAFGVFTRIGCLQLMRHLLVYGNHSLKPPAPDDKALGELALLANEFDHSKAIQNPAKPQTLEMLLSFLPIWDVHNPRDLAYAMTRMHTILTEILPGTDPEVGRLAAKLGINTSSIMVGRLHLNDFVATVFGLFAYGRNVSSPDFAVFDVRKVFSKVGFPPSILNILVRDRALTPSAFRHRLSIGSSHMQKAFREELRRRSFLTGSLALFRQYPLMKLDANRVLILDLELLAELLTAGVYWNIFNSLPANRRETFRELWGRLFEIYAVDLLRDFYPGSSQILTADQKYDGGQVDALLDFGDVVVVFEIKSSLLTEAAKRSGDASKFVFDFERKFVQNQKGAPKALLQLAASCKAVASRKILTAARPARIYPVCVSDEPGVETFFFTNYANEAFQKVVPIGSCIQPVTMMSINELEEVLPYVSANDFSWAELLDFRHRSDGGAYSVHQAVYDLSRAEGVSARRNQAIRTNFDEVWKIISRRFVLPKAG
ncbi:MAG TPA: hypothetical protein VGR72_07980 [Candidatus Acidoferrales bacterium]|nr:hypothetical protein [Candidatus Acidoferrales bacterium]